MADSAPGTLLVASAGGHLTQLHQLRPRLHVAGERLADQPVTWVTFDTPQSRSLLAGEDVVFARYTAPRDVRGVAANFSLARRLISRGGYHRVVSTGAAVALSFLPIARALGVDAHYIESATRTRGPSLTGGLLARMPGIHLYSQHANWAHGRWGYAGSVFDGFAAHRSAHRAAVSSVVVTLGTMRTYGFRRLLERLARILPPGVTGLWQTGCTDVRGIDLGNLDVEVRAAVPAQELSAAMRAADVVVSHAGTGSALAAIEVGKCPVLVPRSPEMDEHVDDHQFHTAEMLSARGLAVSASNPEELTCGHLELAAGTRVDRVTAPPPVDLTGTPSAHKGQILSLAAPTADFLTWLPF